MKKLHYFTQTNPINYEDIASNSSRHLRYYDYKHLKDVTWSDSESNVVWSDVFGAIMLIMAFLSITVMLFLSEV